MLSKEAHTHLTSHSKLYRDVLPHLLSDTFLAVNFTPDSAKP